LVSGNECEGFVLGLCILYALDMNYDVMVYTLCSVTVRSASQRYRIKLMLDGWFTCVNVRDTDTTPDQP